MTAIIANQNRYTPIRSVILLTGSLLGLLLATGCTTTSSTSNAGFPEKGQTVPTTVIDSLPICSLNESGPYITLINSAAELSRFYQDIANEEDSEDLEDLPLVDFASASVILAGVGQKPTSGYQVNYLHSNSIMKNGSAIDMTITTVSPDDEDDTVATVLTSPCVLVETPKLENLKKASLWDQNFDLLVTATQ